MATSEPITDAGQAAERITSLLERVREEGRRLLVVIGAGCSRAAGVPLMSHVYNYLQDQLKPEACQVADTYGHLSRLRGWLAALASEGRPRSLAARALGLLQQPQLLEDKDKELHQHLAGVWDRFGLAFLRGEVNREAGRQPIPILEAVPTVFHSKIASWVQDDLASVISLNFDGLMREGIKKVSGGECVILADRKELDGHWFGETNGHSSVLSVKPLHSVIKIWGDVFHATCRNGLCRAHGKPAALYDLRRSEVEIGKRLLCPDCGEPRQLQIYFTGYQKKEEGAEDLLDAIRERVVPAVGGILTVGVSGLWDMPLIRLLSDIGGSLQSEDETPQASERVLCLDPDKSFSFLASELRHSGTRVCYLACEADQVAEKLLPVSSDSIGCKLEDEPATTLLHGEMLIKWTDHLCREGKFGCPKPLKGLGYHTGPMFDQFRLIRQLGLKTALVQASETPEPSKPDKQEHDHNRLVHSVGAAHIGFEWITRLIKEKGDTKGLRAQQFSPTVLRCAAFFACLTHDMNHLPFTHLIEEVFEELHWTTTPWTEKFRHDHGVLNCCNSDLAKWAKEELNDFASGIGKLPIATLQGLVSRAIEGRTGIPALDAIVNSPIDADKVEYIASDSLWTGQHVHLPIRAGLQGQGSQWTKWLDAFFADQTILPSGILAISGSGAENAYQLLEERMWLYKQLYFRPAFRAVERIARHLLTRWLTWNVGHKLAGTAVGDKRWADGGVDADQGAQTLNAVMLGDSRAIKGRLAAELLWKGLTNPKEVFDDETLAGTEHMNGEPRLAILIGKQVAKVHERSPSLKEWYSRCIDVLEVFLKNRRYEDFAQSALATASWSNRMYLPKSSLPEAAEIVRVLEYESEPSALVDLAVIPPVLSYASSRRTSRGRVQLHADCWAVPHEDPERWGRRTGRWVPLCQTVLARRDNKRWVQVLVVSPRPSDQPTIHHLLDRFRLECKKVGIPIQDETPEGE